MTEPLWKAKVAAETARELRHRSTPTEDALWQALRNRQLDGAKFRRQHRIGAFVADFCCVERRLVVEIDGPIHVQSRAADEQRQELIEDEGYRVIRVTAHRVETDLPAVLEKIQSEVLPSPPSPLPRAGEVTTVGVRVEPGDLGYEAKIREWWERTKQDAEGGKRK